IRGEHRGVGAHHHRHRAGRAADASGVGMPRPRLRLRPEQHRHADAGRAPRGRGARQARIPHPQHPGGGPARPGQRGTSPGGRALRDPRHQQHPQPGLSLLSDGQLSRASSELHPMALPVPNLDDRSWKQIVDEAVRLIPRYCPEWTNHNASDPGVTLLELYAWMTEMVIYRLNKVPEKNFLAFLDLIGVRLKAPEPATVVLEFTPADGIQGELLVKKGTQVAPPQAPGTNPATLPTFSYPTLPPVPRSI